MKGMMTICFLVMTFPVLGQSISNGTSIQSLLDRLYVEMIPMCKGLIHAARWIGAFGALWFVAVRVWRNIAHAEPVDIYGLLRPFVLGFCITVFPSVIDLINGILQPLVKGTSVLQSGTTDAMRAYFQQQEQPAMGLDVMNPMNWVREALRELLELLFQGVALVIHVIRTFYLIVLAIIGPIVFGLSIYDGFQHLITVWLARYVNVFLWLPVANIFGAIIAKLQQLMMIGSGVQVPIPGQAFAVSDPVYMIFLLIGIVGYCTVPSVANYIVNAGGGNTLLHKLTTLGSGAARSAGAVVSGGMSLDAFGNSASRMNSSMAEQGLHHGYFKDKLKH